MARRSIEIDRDKTAGKYLDPKHLRPDGEKAMKSNMLAA